VQIASIIKPYQDQ